MHAHFSSSCNEIDLPKTLWWLDRGVLWTWPDMWSVHAQPVKQVALILDVGLWPTFCLRRVEHIFTIARSDQFNQGWGEVHANESSHGDLCTVWVLVKVDSSRFEHQDFHLQSVCQNIKQSSCNHHKGFFWTLISPSQPYTVRNQRKLFPQKSDNVYEECGSLSLLCHVELCDSAQELGPCPKSPQV